MILPTPNFLVEKSLPSIHDQEAPVHSLPYSFPLLFLHLISHVFCTLIFSLIVSSALYLVPEFLFPSFFTCLEGLNHPQFKKKNIIRISIFQSLLSVKNTNGKGFGESTFGETRVNQ
jgi:hypothetical protein